MKHYQITREKYLSIDEFTSLLETCNKYRKTDLRNVCLFLTAIHTGARAKEILNIRTNDLNKDGYTVHIRGLKGGKDREIPLPKALFMDLMSLIPDENGRIFPITYRRLCDIWHNYRPCNKPFHALRHTFGVMRYKKHRDLYLIQIALGHRSIANTIAYVQHVTETEELKRLVNE